MDYKPKNPDYKQTEIPPVEAGITGVPVVEETSAPVEFNQLGMPDVTPSVTSVPTTQETTAPVLFTQQELDEPIYNPKNPDLKQTRRDIVKPFEQIEIEPPPPLELPIVPNAVGAVLKEGDFQSPNYRKSRTGWRIRSDGSAEFNSGVAVSRVDIPDTTTTNSFHVDTQGNTWWGATSYASAVGSVSSTGAATFSNVTITGTNTSIQVPLAVPFTAGETLAKADAVFMAITGAVGKIIHQIETTGSGGHEFGQTTLGAVKRGQSFSSASAFRITGIRCDIKTSGTPTDSMQVSIQSDTAGLPSGTVLAYATKTAASLTGGFVTYDFTFDTEVNYPGGSVTYWIVFERTGTLDNVNIYLAAFTLGGAYAGGGMAVNTGSWGLGAATTDLNGALLMSYTPGKVYRTNSSSSDYSATFIGFCYDTAVVANASGNIAVSGVATGFSGLTAGSFYYTSSTYGGVSTSAGVYTRKVGLALTTTQMLITNIW